LVGGHAVQSGDNVVQCATFSQCDPCASMVLADHGVAFPVAYAAFLIGNPRAFVNAEPVLDRAPALLTARVTFSAAQVLPQAAAMAFVFINVHVDRLMADSQSAFQRKPARFVRTPEISSTCLCPLHPQFAIDSIPLSSNQKSGIVALWCAASSASSVLLLLGRLSSSDTTAACLLTSLQKLHFKVESAN